MRLLIVCIQLIIIFLIGVKPTMPITQSGELSDCLISSNCVNVQWSFEKLNEAYEKLTSLASNLPRVTVIKNERNYWHGVVRSLIFRFPDDLEILRIPSKNIIQVRSSSRIGVGDLGVNQKRVNQLYSELINNNY